MVAPKKGGGDTGDKGKKVLLGTLEELAEFATGVATGSIIGGILQAGKAGAFRGLKGSLFSMLFGGKSKADEADKGQLSDSPKKLADIIKSASGDAKLGELARVYMANGILIQSSSRSDTEKEEALKREQERYKAAVNEYLVSKVKQSLQSLVAELTDIDNDPAKLVAKKFKAAQGRPDTYREDFFQWLEQELMPAQRETIMSRREKITTVRMITDMLDFSPNFAMRFRYIDFGLGKPSFKELGSELVGTALAGALDDHPLVQKADRLSRENVTQRQQKAEIMDRGYANRRKV